MSAASPNAPVDCAPAASREGWIKVDDQTLLMLRLLAGERGLTVPALIGALAKEQFPVWFDDGGADEHRRPDPARDAEGFSHD